MENYNLTSEVKTLLKDIDFIGGCPEGKKISFTQKKYLEPNAWSVNNVKKYLSWEDRNTVITHIDDILIKTGDFLSKETNKEILELFLKFLEKMKLGLANLGETYKDEPDVFSSITVYKEQLSMLIRNVEEKKQKLISLRTSCAEKNEMFDLGKSVDRSQVFRKSKE